ncbi:DNA-dependent DNA helicase and ATPase [Pelomyxa schiedti]|nr:DNA-dependent DNA helicase and ATPase [Pelomyxa schiedti]
MYSLQRILKYFQQKAQLLTDFSSQTSKLIGRTPEILWFEEGTVSSAWAKVLKAEHESVRLQSLAAQQMNELVCNPLCKVLDDMETSISDGQHQLKLQSDAISALQKAKEKFHKSSKDAEIFEAQMKELEGDPKKRTEFLKSDKKLFKMREDLKEIEVSYRQQIIATNIIQEEFYTKGMPAVLAELHHAFLIRIHQIKDFFVMFSKIATKLNEDFHPCTQQLQSEVISINPENDMEEFTQKLDDAFTIPVPFSFEAYKTGSSLVQTKRQSIFAKKGTHDPCFSTAIFHVPLEDVVAKQNLQHTNSPTLVKIPLIVKYCCESILYLGGTKTPCIFRISGTVSEIQTLKDNLNKGVYLPPVDVHTCAALLKLWLRALPEPLIPMNLYTSCVDAQDPFAILPQLPEINRLTLGYITSFLQCFCTPEAEEVTSMSRDSIAAIFAPCFFRTPETEELAERLVAAEKEKQFLSTLFSKYVAPSEIPHLEPFSYSNWPQIQLPTPERSVPSVAFSSSSPSQSPLSLPPTPTADGVLLPTNLFARKSFDTSNTSISTPSASLSELMGDIPGFDLDMPPLAPISSVMEVNIDDLIGNMFLRKSEIVSSSTTTSSASSPVSAGPSPTQGVIDAHSSIEASKVSTEKPASPPFNPPPISPPPPPICPEPAILPPPVEKPLPAPPPARFEIPPPLLRDIPPPLLRDIPPPTPTTPQEIPPPALCEILPNLCEIPPPMCDIPPPTIREIPPPIAPPPISCPLAPPIDPPKSPQSVILPPPTAAQGHCTTAAKPPRAADPPAKSRAHSTSFTVHTTQPTHTELVRPTTGRKGKEQTFSANTLPHNSTSSGKVFSGFRLPGRSSSTKKT